MAATSTSTLPFFSSPTTNPHKPIKTLQSPNFVRPFSASKRNSLRISHVRAVAPKLARKALAVSGLMSGSDSETDAELEQNNLNSDATIDLQLPRRSLLVKFTCDLCNERTSKLVNRLAYEKGLIYVQCAGCLKYHKLVDNLGLVVEYDLRGDIDLESNADEV
ncbi:putative mitochondrial import protein TIM15 [Rosa chinensis]|uniref:Putative mitochondrial import protein TIM15 n=1 Tax=Rosa chinensis TaxID=74649 RepID=A0A2P6R201_ROSCH|nr:uncharacterized protein C24H6.02c [Rosa chinensis]PRQ40470.1 putative mitochondrial import protein TIM15 [Rosa chinensis]